MTRDAFMRCCSAEYRMNRLAQSTAPIAVAALVLVVMSVYAATFRNLLAVGEVQAEVTHRVFALPVFLFLLWQARGALRWDCVFPSLAGIALLSGAGLLWSIGEMTFIRALSEGSVIVMIPMAVFAIFGRSWLRVLLFPLCFLLFAVPLRGPLVDWQVALTADFVHIALRFTGIPVFRDGAFFELPGRSWSVADECSGVEYLSACLMFATLFAWTLYAANSKRTWFVLGALVLGLAGNWLRAYLTIAVAHLSGNKIFAQGHGTFGWILFAILLFLYCWIGWRYRDSMQDRSPQSPATEKAVTRHNARTILPTVAMALAGLVVWPVALAAMGQPAEGTKTQLTALSLPPVWAFREDNSCQWKPELQNPLWTRDYCFARQGEGVPIHLSVSGFGRQNWNTKLVTSVHKLAPSGWSMTQRDQFSAKLGSVRLAGRAYVIRKGGERYRVWQWYALQGEFTGSDIAAKWLQLKARLSGVPERSYWVAIAIRADQGIERADMQLQAFLDDLGSPLSIALFASP